MAQNTPEWAFITLLFLCTLPGGGGDAILRQWTPQEVYSVLDKSCFLAVVDPESSPGGGAGLTAALNALIQAFYGESLVQIGIINAKKFLWPSGKALRVKDGVSGRYIEGSDGVDLLWFPRRVPDRSCLVRPAHTLTPPVGRTVPAPRTAPAMVGYLNDKCGTFRNLNGTLNNGGRHRLDILRNLFRVESVSETTMGMVYTCYMASDNPFNQSHAWAEFRDQEGAASLDHCLSYNDCHGSHPTNYHVSQNTKSHTPFTSFTNKDHKSRKTAQKHNSDSELGSPPIAQCKVLHTPPTKEEFFHNYLKRSKPFILRNHTTTWTAFSKWTNEYLRKTFGEKEVNIKLTPSGDYEGVEKADLWENFKTFKIPQEVKRQLQFPDLVTVRPASKDVKFSEFMDLINKTARQGAGERLLSAYLEYSSIPAYLPSLEGDLDEPKFASRLLQRKHLNIWLSDGHTLGRLHFDQYDNLLCQVDLYRFISKETGNSRIPVKNLNHFSKLNSFP